MERVRFVEHRGQKVLLIDYSGIQDEAEGLNVIEQRKDVVAGEAALLTLTDVTNAHFSRAMLDAAKAAAVYDRPHLKRAAIVGADTVSPRGVPDAVATFSSRHWRKCRTREEALDWLVDGDAETANA